MGERLDVDCFGERGAKGVAKGEVLSVGELVTGLDETDGLSRRCLCNPGG